MPEDLHRPKDANVTGREYKSSAHFLLECKCPHCQGPQWHAPGAAKCIYCDVSMNVSHMKIVSRTEAPEPAGKNPGPDAA